MLRFLRKRNPKHPKEQLRILGSPACLEPRRAKPAGTGGPCAVKIHSAGE